MPKYNNPPISVEEFKGTTSSEGRLKVTNFQRVKVLREISSLIRNGGTWDPRDEGELQVVVVSWSHYRSKDPRLVSLFAIQNERPGSQAYRIEMILKGMRPGVSDLLLPVSSGPFLGLWLELKFDTHDVTDEQSTFLQEMISLGWASEVIYTLRQYQTFVQNYLDDPSSFVSGF